jgi:hypothetical protein
MNNVNIAGSTSGYVVVQAGSQMNTQANFHYQHCGYCPGCVVQAYVGLMPGDPPAASEGTIAGCPSFQAHCRQYLSFGDNAMNYTWQAPSSPGTYYFRFGTTLDYVCQPICVGSHTNYFAVCVLPNPT